MPGSGDKVHDRDFVDLTCPHCGPDRRSPANQKRKVMRVWQSWDGAQTFNCVRCGAHGLIGHQRLGRLFPVKPRARDVSVEQRMRLAQTLWQFALPILGTPAECYLRRARGYGGPLPPTLRYLPTRGRHPHVMIAAFGFAHEVSSGELRPPEAPAAVHLTRLKPDASGRLDKIMVGPVSGKPITLAPVNDGLGLVIAEGIEDALSLHAATGLGAWAAGSATHMSKLEPGVPDYVTWVTLAEDDDEAGRKGVGALARALSERGCSVSVMALGRKA